MVLSRRSALRAVAAGVVGASCSDEGPAVPRAPTCSDPVVDDEVTRVASWIAETTPSAVFDELVDEVEAGLRYETLIAAIYQLGIALPYDSDQHPRAVMHAAHDLAFSLASADPRPILFTIVATAGQGMDAQLPCTESLPAGADGQAELAAALEALDVEKSQAAVTALHRADAAEPLRDLLFEFGARDHNWIGHTMIHVAQGWRLLEASRWERSELALRSMAGDITTRTLDEWSAPFDRNRELAAVDRTIASGYDAAAVLELLGELREASPESAADAVIAQLDAGVGAPSLWEALRLAAAELTLRFPFHSWIKFAIHSVTANNALRWAFDQTSDGRLRRLLLLQAASWLPLHRVHCIDYNGENSSLLWKIDELAPAGGDVSLDQVVASLNAGPDASDAAIADALAHLEGGGDTAAFVAALRDVVVSRLHDPHQIKYPVASIEEALLADGAWRNVLLATAASFVNNPDGVARYPEIDELAAALAGFGP